MEAISSDSSSLGPSTLAYFFPALDFLPVDSRSTAAGSAQSRVVSRALEVSIDSPRFSTTQFPRYSMRLTTSPSPK
jgi:hypothetical protein